jgi:hypothetical protein
MADNWVHGGPNGLIDASYIWLPIKFNKYSGLLLLRPLTAGFPSSLVDVASRRHALEM